MNQKIAVGVVFVSAMFMNIIDVTIVNVALPTIGHDFQDPTNGGGRHRDRVPRQPRRFHPLVGLAGRPLRRPKECCWYPSWSSAIGSALCGVAQNVTELVAFRVVQGAGGSMMIPVGMAMLYRAFPPSERIRVASIIPVPTTLAPALGPVLGGFLVTNLTWRWVFFVNVPIGVAAILFGALCPGPCRSDRRGTIRPSGFPAGRHSVSVCSCTASRRAG